MENTLIYQDEPICALATASGIGAIAIIRISGRGAVGIVGSVFRGKQLEKVKSHTVHFGTIRDGDEVIDEVLVTVFRSPSSFTKEDAVEISCHGSDYIIRSILKLLVKKGSRIARPGEFTQRAFLNGQFDLVQAEAVADLIAADSEASHRTALNQLRGGFSRQLASLREELIHFASLVELELDFGEEDVVFAGRNDLRDLVNRLNKSLRPLIESFDFGNALKEGIPVAIIGAPNVGKSTLLNALLNEEKAIVTAIAGTTRDVIEDTLVIGGIKFRIIDTAGIRETTDLVESIGIERSKRAMEKADIVLLLFDSEETRGELDLVVEGIQEEKKLVWVMNKVDLKKNARLFRKSPTEAEGVLWELIRNRQFAGLKFRRQHPVEEGFVLDFFCAEYRLAIEVDGAVHDDNDQHQYDLARSERLNELYGIEIIRIQNQDILTAPEMVLQTIRQAVDERKSRLQSGRVLPSPGRRGVGGEVIRISAATALGLEDLKTKITQLAHSQTQSGTVVTNLRHYEHLLKTHQALGEVLQGLDDGVTGDFLAQDIRLALFHLGEITGTIVTDDLLANIFSKFCIGK